jgi:dUTP pyrophosphatase
MGQTISNSFVWSVYHQHNNNSRTAVSDADSAKGALQYCDHQPPPILVAVNHTVDVPARATDGAAGFDVVASENVSIESGERALVSTGVKMAMPENVVPEDHRVCMFATLKGRSGLAKRGIDVHSGTIDCDYRGEIKALLINNSTETFNVHAGDRIAQLIFSLALVPTLVSVEEDVEMEDATERGAGGFGSTGVQGAVHVSVDAENATVAEAQICISE